MLLAGPIQDDSLPGDLAGERLRSTFGASMSAFIGDFVARDLPLVGILQEKELDRAEGLIRRPRVTREGRVIPGVSVPKKMIPPDEANERFGELGLTFDEPVSEEALGIIVRRKREEITRRNILRRGPQGVVPMGAKFITSLALSVIDPINVASAFIPVVGEARLASLVARFGKNSARFRTGLIEGAVGNAAIEPILLSSAARDQSDYTALDSLLNVTIGSILGGGLHVGIGKISDRLKAARPETREAALRGSVAQMAEGRPVDAATILRTDPAMHETGPILRPLVEALENVERTRARVASLEERGADLATLSDELMPALKNAAAADRRFEALLDQSDELTPDVTTRLRDLVDRVGDEIDIEARSRIAEASRRSADAATTPDPELGARASENARETDLRVRRGEADDLDAELAELQTEIADVETRGEEGFSDELTKIIDDAEQTGELARVAGRCLMRG